MSKDDQPVAHFYNSIVPIQPKLDLRAKKNWKKFQIVMGLDEQPMKHRTAIFLTSFGPDALEILDNFHFTHEEDKNDVTKVIDNFSVLRWQSK